MRPERFVMATPKFLESNVIQQYSIRDALLARHGLTDTICVTALKEVDGKNIATEHFCAGVDEAAALIERSYQREDIKAIWSNLQRLKVGSSQRKKEFIESYTSVLVDIDRKSKKDAQGRKVNATEEEREVLLESANQVAAFLSPELRQPVLADSGNGYHLSWRIGDATDWGKGIPVEEAQKLYKRLLVLLKRIFERPDLNMEIDASLADETQVVTVWGTYNRKYPDLPGRPQRQSRVLSMPEHLLQVGSGAKHAVPVTASTIDIFLTVNQTDGASADAATEETRHAPKDKQRANREWLENYGVPDLIDFWSPEISYESESYDKDGEEHHPIAPCPCHEGEDFHDHSHRRDCEIIVFPDGGIGISCFSRDFGLKQVIKKMNEIKGEKYPHLVFEEPDPLKEALEFGAEVAEEGVEGAEEQAAGTESWSQIADELDEVRRGKGKFRNKAGNIEEKALPRHIAEERVLQFVKDVFEKRGKGQFFFDAYPYVYLPEEEQVVRLQDDTEAYGLLGKMRLRITQGHTNLVRENLNAHIMEFGKQTRVEKLGCLRGEAIYVNNGRGGMFKITTDSISEVPNGTDGVLMHYPDLKPFPALDEAKLEDIRKKLNGLGGKVTDSLFCQHLNGHFEEGGSLVQQQYQQLVIMRLLSLFIGNSLDLRPIMIALGEQNSGKSTLWEKFMWLLYGTQYQSSALPSKRRDFVAAMTNNAINVFDNIDSVNFDNPRSDYPEYIDLMCKASTGGKIPIAELYKTNVQKMYNLRCDQFFTARVNPFPSHRSDLSRRTLFFPIRMPSPLEYKTTEEIKTALADDADEIKLEILVRLQNVLRALVANKKSYPPVSQMHSFETFTMRVADHEGWADEMHDIWEGYMGDYRERITEDSPLVEYVRRWIGMTTKSNAGRWARAGEIYADLQKAYGQDFTKMWRSNAVFGRKIRENLTALRVLGIDTKKPQGNQFYKFEPSPEQMARCRDAWNDSAPSRYLGDDALGVPDSNDVLG
jgi:hypothetical protein